MTTDCTGEWLYLADEEHHRSLSSSNPPHIVQACHAMFDAQEELGSLDGSPRDEQTATSQHIRRQNKSRIDTF